MSQHQTDEHPSMRAVQDGSWYGLSDGERRVMRGLGTFIGGFTLEAAEAVAGATLMDLATLAERSFINRLPQPDGSTRYAMHEVIRQYAVERLTELPDPEQYAERTSSTWTTLFGSRRGAKRLGRLRRKGPGLRNCEEDPNLTTALAWALDQLKSEAASRLCAALLGVCIYSGGPACHFHDAVERALAMQWDDSSPTAIGARARTLHAAGYEADALGDFHRGARYFKEAVVLSQQIGNHDQQAACLRGLSYTAGCLGDHHAGERYARQSLALCRRVGDLAGVAWSYEHLAKEAFALGKLAETKRLVADVIVRFEQLGNTFGEYSANIFLGNVYLVDHEWSGAIEAYGQSLALRAGAEPPLSSTVARSSLGLLRSLSLCAGWSAPPFCAGPNTAWHGDWSATACHRATIGPTSRQPGSSSARIGRRCSTPDGDSHRIRSWPPPSRQQRSWPTSACPHVPSLSPLARSR